MTSVLWISFVTALAVSLILVPLARRLFLRIGFVDQPGQRKIHAAAIPYGGGAALFATLLVVLGAGFAAVALRDQPWLSWLPGRALIETNAGGIFFRSPELLGVLGAAAILFVMGLVDDRRRLSAGPKLAAQFAAAAVVVWFLDIHATFFLSVSWLTHLVTLLWIVVVTNAFNFLDNMDGLSAGVAAIVLVVLAVVTVSVGQIFVPVLAVVLLGALLGFLYFNFSPASVFLGDAGSQVVGFLIAVLTVLANYYHGAPGEGWFGPFMPLVLLAIPLYDFTSVTLIRMARGKSPFVGDTNHFSHRLVALGLSRPVAVLVIYLATVTTAIGALLLRTADTVGAVLVFGQTLAILAIIAVFERIAGGRVLKDD
jgi:UDP-GlcNAc:undecaprenyl-phosphate GlcNAc-1-phosphate transferase